jgi:hypothetical protein
MRSLLVVIASGCAAKTPPPSAPVATAAPIAPAAESPPSAPPAESPPVSVEPAPEAGTTPVEPHADFEYGREGPGPGGGGSGWGTAGSPHASPNPQQRPKIVLGQPTLSAHGLEAAIVRRYIKRAVDKLLGCYYKELNAIPTLDGTLQATFTIGADGRVSTAHADGMGNTGVETCVADVVRRMQFPAPKGGTSLVVTYPVTFHPG